MEWSEIVFDTIKELILKLTKSPTKWNNLENIKLIHSKSHKKLYHLWKIFHIHFIYDNIDIDNFGREKFANIDQSSYSTFIWSRCCSEVVVELCCMSMYRECNLIESCIKKLLTKLSTSKHITVGNGLHPIISYWFGISDILSKFGMDTRFASRYDDTIGHTRFVSISDLFSDFGIIDECTVLGISIETKNTLHIASSDDTYPNTIFTSCYFFREEGILHFLFEENKIM